LNHTQQKAQAEIGKNDQERTAIGHESAQILNEQNRLNKLIKDLSDQISNGQTSGQNWRDAISALSSPEVLSAYAELSKAQSEYSVVLEKTDILRNAINQIREAEKLYHFLAEEVTPEPELIQREHNPSQSSDNTGRGEEPTTLAQ
jgi:chromosome segregation ATPase